MTSWLYNDGGREFAGFKGKTGDCVVRAIAIATGLPYGDVYEAMGAGVAADPSKAGRRQRERYGSTPRNGVARRVYEPWLLNRGWAWTPTMAIGQGCTVHLRPDELPGGRIIVRVSRHLVAMIDGVVHDTHDPTRDASRCVYGFYQQA